MLVLGWLWASPPGLTPAGVGAGGEAFHHPSTRSGRYAERRGCEGIKGNSHPGSGVSRLETKAETFSLHTALLGLTIIVLVISVLI